MADIPMGTSSSGACGGCGSGCGCKSKSTPGLISLQDIKARVKSKTEQPVVNARIADLAVVNSEDLTQSAYARFSAEQKRKMRMQPGNPAAHRIVKIRRTVQIATFLLFVSFFFLTTNTSDNLFGVPKNLFMTMDFLNTLKNSIASHTIPVYAIGPGLFILLLTLWGGRIFCGWICPLGTLIDISDRLLYRKGKLFYSKKRSDTRKYRNWKYLYLLVGLGAIVFGVDILAFGDPISLITRTFTFCIYPPIAYVWNSILNVADSKYFHLGSAIYRMGGNMDALRMPNHQYYNGVGVMLIFIGIIALSSFQERFWCRNLCPYGGLLALISRVSWLRHYIKMDGCIHCKKCEFQSRMGCYDNLDKNAKQEEMHSISECIQCFRCETVCPTDVIQIQARVPASIKEALHLSPKGEAPKPEPQTEIDLGKRRVIASVGAGIIWGGLTKSTPSSYQGIIRKYNRDNKAIRPPGALPESEFLAACTRCAECMKVCPTNALQPATFEFGMDGLWTPILIPSVGPCAEKCTACGDVCPTGAIRPFTWQDKRYRLKLGLAQVDQSICVAWNGGRNCIVCAEVCPYSAVVFSDTFDDTLPKDPSLPIDHIGVNGKEDNRGRKKRVPTVDERLCTGCGLCEYHCPVMPTHAIIVYTFQVDQNFKEPKENWWDGFWREDWDKRKDVGKNREYAATKAELDKHMALEGPAATASPGASYNPDPNPGG